MPPKGVSCRGDDINDPYETLIRRARKSRQFRNRLVLDQITKTLRPPASMFEPRLPETRPQAKNFDEYLSVNIVSSLLASHLSKTWGADLSEFICVETPVDACHTINLRVTWEPVYDDEDPSNDNEHHGAIRNVVELYYSDLGAYENAITMLAKSSEILPECISALGLDES